MKRIFTIGYEGASVDRFFDALHAAHVDTLLDVRELPLSRRRGFSKSAVKSAVEARGLAYRHEKLLGTPREIRHRLRADGDYPRFFRDFKRHLARHGFLLQRLAHDIKGNVALMCYEKDAMICHRWIVAEALGKLVGRRPVHLGVGGKVKNKSHRRTS